MRIAELREILAEEQARLDLEEEWEISIRWAKKGEAAPFKNKNQADYWAWVTWSKDHPLHSATIIVVRDNKSNYRAVIVHELMHILLNKKGDSSFEKAIDAIAAALT